MGAILSICDGDHRSVHFFVQCFCHLSLRFTSRSTVHSSNHHILHWGCTLFVSHVHHKDERWMLGPKSTTKMKDGFGGIYDQWHSLSLGRHFRACCEQICASCLG